MKRFVLFLWIAIAAVPGGSWGVVRAAGADVWASGGPERRHRGYVKDDWSVWYRGRKVEGAVASSFSDLGGGYGNRMPGRSFTAAGRWRGLPRRRSPCSAAGTAKTPGRFGSGAARSRGCRPRRSPLWVTGAGQGPLEGGFRGSHGEGRRGLVVRKPRQKG